MIRAIIFDYSGTLGPYGGPLYDGVADLLARVRARDIRVGVLTRAPERHMVLAGVRPLVDLVWSERVKADDEFVAMARELGADMASTLVVRNAASVEIASGRRLGAQTAWIHVDGDIQSVLEVEGLL